MAQTGVAFLGLYEHRLVDGDGRITQPWYDALQSLTARANSSGDVTAIGDLTLNRLIVGAGGSDISAVVSTDGQIPIGATSDGTVTPANIIGISPVVVTNSPHGITISAPSAVTGPAGADTDVQFNDAGVFGGNAALTFDKAKKQLAVTADTAWSQFVVQNATPNMGLVAINPRTANYEDITLGYKLNAAGDYIPNGTGASYLWRASDVSGLEINDGLTPGVAAPFASGVGIAVTGPLSSPDPSLIQGYDYGLSVGANPGTAVIGQRNDAGSGAASTVGGEQRGGTRWYVWQDATGAMRYGPARPTEDDSISDTSGILFGSGLTAAQVSARVMVGF